MPYEDVEVRVFRKQFVCSTCGTPVKVFTTEDGAHVYDDGDIKHVCPNRKCQHTFWLPEIYPKITYKEA
jgi:hypothetical protein